MMYLYESVFMIIKKVYNIVKRYFREIHGMPLSDKSWEYVKMLRILDILTIALILYLKRDASNITKKNIFRKYSHDQYIEQIETR